MVKDAILCGDALTQLKTLESESVDLVVTSSNLINDLYHRCSGMRDTDLAYMAGILDSEGSIMIRKSTYRITNPKYADCKNPQYTPRIAIKMTDIRPLQLFKDNFSGNLYKDKIVRNSDSDSSHRSNKILYIYGAEHNLAYNILNHLLSFLIVKKEQAILSLQLRDLKQQYKKRVSDGKFHGQQYSQELLNLLEENWKKVKMLNGSRFI